MKKYLLSLAVLLMGVSLFTSCEDDDDDVNPQDLKKVTHAAYVVNAGQQATGSTGTLTRVDMGTWTTAQNVFSQVNGRNLGVTANDAIIYGSKMYIVVEDVYKRQSLNSKMPFILMKPCSLSTQ